LLEKPVAWIGSSLEDLKQFPPYVLHAFQKKSKHGIATPKQDIDLIRQRLNQAKEHHEKFQGEKK
jgi:phage-related protein